MTEPEILPAPLLPREVDLRGYEFMPFFGDRLLGSETWIGGSDAEKVAMLKIWWRAFSREVPAGSLPNKEQLLAEYAGYGPSPKTWKRMRDTVMHHFVLCADNRWYHPFVCWLAINAWKSRLADRMRGVKARIGATKKKLGEAVTDQDKQHISGLLQEQESELLRLSQWSVTAEQYASVTPENFACHRVREERIGEDRRGEEGLRSKPAAAASSSTRSPDLSTAHAGNGAAAAATSLIFPEKLSGSDSTAAASLLVDIDDPQLILDELAGKMRSEPVKSPMALLKAMIAQRRAGQFVASFAYTVQAERELGDGQRRMESTS